MSASPYSSASYWDSEHDDAIQAAAERYLPGLDWRIYKAQLYQESKLDPKAESPVGAQGIAQFMPETWAEVARAIGEPGASPYAADVAIEAGAYYTAQLRHQWRRIDREPDRHSYALASYNAGIGNTRQAWRLCGEPGTYADGVPPCLPDVTGHHAEETKSFVQRVWRWWTQMIHGVEP